MSRGVAYPRQLQGTAVKLYKSDMTCKEISQWFRKHTSWDVRPGTVYRWLKNKGVKLRRRGTR